MQFLFGSCFMASSIPSLELALDSYKLERMHGARLYTRVTDELVKITRVLTTS